MNDKIKPIIDSTYPALMAGLCLTFLSIFPDFLKNKLLIFLISTASLLFILSSFFIFACSVNITWRSKPVENKALKSNKPIFWKIGKWTFFFGIFLLVIATILIVYKLWFSDLLYWSVSNFSNLFNSTNLTITNQT